MRRVEMIKRVYTGVNIEGLQMYETEVTVGNLIQFISGTTGSPSRIQAEVLAIVELDDGTVITPSVRAIRFVKAESSV